MIFCEFAKIKPVNKWNLYPDQRGMNKRATTILKLSFFLFLLPFNGKSFCSSPGMPLLARGGIRKKTAIEMYQLKIYK